jgi:DNA replication factor GINS
LARECDDPYDDAVIRVNDEIDAAMRVVQSIHERRVGKVVERASFAANGMGDVPDGLTAEERALFEDLVERIETNRDRVQEIVAGDTEAPVAPTQRETSESTEASEDDDDDTESENTAAALMDDGVTDGGPGSTDVRSHSRTSEDSDTLDAPSQDSDAGPDRERLRITSDVGEIYGVDDRVYDLWADDVVTLPTENAGPLLERGAAERIEDDP